MTTQQSRFYVLWVPGEAFNGATFGVEYGFFQILQHYYWWSLTL
jgi:hypothetical protein